MTRKMILPNYAAKCITVLPLASGKVNSAPYAISFSAI